MLPSSKLNKIFCGYFDPENIFKIVNVNNFRGDLTYIPAKKEALVNSGCFLAEIPFWST